MKCPIDNELLVVTDRNNIEIDYCPSCRGVWLDRGELDKIIDRAGTQTAQQREYREERRHEGRDHRDREYDADSYRNDYRHESHDPKKKRRESFLGDLFDF